MSDLVERYVHQVGRYLPQKERGEIQEELRSQIHDQLEDRFGDKATQDDVAAVLKELGDPKSMAVSYAGEQYLIGPTLYPIMMMVLQRGWVIVPFVVVIVHVLLALLSSGADNLIGLIIDDENVTTGFHSNSPRSIGSHTLNVAPGWPSALFSARMRP